MNKKRFDYMETKLVADKTSTWNGIKVNEYLLTKHNRNKISMFPVNLPSKPLAITIPVVEEQIKVINHRIDDIEHKE